MTKLERCVFAIVGSQADNERGFLLLLLLYKKSIETALE